jgi:hypothetical protein
MKLTYRGVDYDYNPPMLEVTESEIKCQYRGHAYRYGYAKHVPIAQPAEQFSYRGVAYQTTRQGQVLQLEQGQRFAPNMLTRLFAHSTGPNVGPNSSLAHSRDKLVGTSPAAQARRQLLQASSQLHQNSIERALQHRMTVAKQQGNEKLIHQLEAEMRQSAGATTAK